MTCDGEVSNHAYHCNPTTVANLALADVVTRRNPCSFNKPLSALQHEDFGIPSVFLATVRIPFSDQHRRECMTMQVVNVRPPGAPPILHQTYMAARHKRNACGPHCRGKRDTFPMDRHSNTTWTVHKCTSTRRSLRSEELAQRPVARDAAQDLTGAACKRSAIARIHHCARACNCKGADSGGATVDSRVQEWSGAPKNNDHGGGNRQVRGAPPFRDAKLDLRPVLHPEPVTLCPPAQSPTLTIAAGGGDAPMPRRHAQHSTLR